MRKRVVLPAPLRPTKPMRALSGKAALALSNRIRGPSLSVTSLIWSIGACRPTSIALQERRGERKSGAKPGRTGIGLNAPVLHSAEVNANAVPQLTVALRDCGCTNCGGLPLKEALPLPCIDLP